jgi:hypothetical protein
MCYRFGRALPPASLSFVVRGGLFLGKRRSEILAFVFPAPNHPRKDGSRRVYARENCCRARWTGPFKCRMQIAECRMKNSRRFAGFIWHFAFCILHLNGLPRRVMT